jgi:forespore regulator of the sigma-K checkpoint
MHVMNLWRQLKRRLRSKRRWLSLGVFVLFAACALAVRWYVGTAERQSSSASALSAFAPAVPNDDAKRQADVLEAIRQSGSGREAVVLKTYVCGEERQELGQLQPDGIAKLHAEHPEWTLRLDGDGMVLFTQSVDDMSPACKEKAFFGIDDKGNLSLFDGVPDKDNVIRTFFQLNIGQLESALPHDTVNQLYGGIRVKDMDEYNSILSTFSDYAVEETQKAMKPQQADK